MKYYSAIKSGYKHLGIKEENELLVYKPVVHEFEEKYYVKRMSFAASNYSIFILNIIKLFTISI